MHLFCSLVSIFCLFYSRHCTALFQNVISLEKPKHTTLSLEKNDELPLALYNVQVHTHISVLPPSLVYYGFLKNGIVL